MTTFGILTRLTRLMLSAGLGARRSMVQASGLEAVVIVMGVVGPYALTVDEGLGRGLNPVLGFEGVGLGARFQMAVFDPEALALEQPNGFAAIGANVLGHDHAIEDSGLLRGGHWRLLFADNDPQPM